MCYMLNSIFGCNTAFVYEALVQHIHIQSAGIANTDAILNRFWYLCIFTVPGPY